MSTKKKNFNDDCKNSCQEDKKNCNITKNEEIAKTVKKKSQKLSIVKPAVAESKPISPISEKSPFDAMRKLSGAELVEWRIGDTELRNSLQGIKIKEHELRELEYQSKLLDRDYQDRRRELAMKAADIRKEKDQLENVKKDAYTSYSKTMEKLAQSKGIADWRKMVIDSNTGIVREETVSPSGAVEVS